ncbi:hypothetical protein ACFYT4_29645 [Streptomyces sp. NPDC004609]|uniref:hypothetical protein n=1 Tax=Streptomyces sp. NPDC004609 TaxID=3364704 RepID=UPI003698A75E
MSDIRLLLERVAEEGGRTTVTSETVHAGAAKLRRRRRAMVAGALAAVVFAGAAAVPVLDQLRDRFDQTSAAGGGKRTAKAADAQSRRLAELLPSGVQEIERIGTSTSPLVLVKEGLFPGDPDPTFHRSSDVKSSGLGPLDGHYRITRAGNEGGISISVVPAKVVSKTPKGLGVGFCTHAVPGSIGECVTDVLSDDRPTRVTWRQPGSGGGTARLVGYLTLKSGDVLVVNAYSSSPSSTPPSVPDYPPLNRTELNELLLASELLPKD